RLTAIIDKDIALHADTRAFSRIIYPEKRRQNIDSADGCPMKTPRARTRQAYPSATLGRSEHTTPQSLSDRAATGPPSQALARVMAWRLQGGPLSVSDREG